MTTTITAILALGISAIIIFGKILGIIKSSFREPINDSLDAIYIRKNILMWDLLIAAKDAKVGIKQGYFLLPQARARATKVGLGMG